MTDPTPAPAPRRRRVAPPWAAAAWLACAALAVASGPARPEQTDPLDSFTVETVVPLAVPGRPAVRSTPTPAPLPTFQLWPALPMPDRPPSLETVAAAPPPPAPPTGNQVAPAAATVAPAPPAPTAGAAPPAPAPAQRVPDPPATPRLPAPVRVVLPADSDAVALSPADRERVDALAARMDTAPSLRVRLRAFAGSTEAIESDARRRALARAIALREQLVARGIAHSRILLQPVGRADDGPPDRIDLVPF